MTWMARVGVPDLHTAYVEARRHSHPFAANVEEQRSVLRLLLVSVFALWTPINLGGLQPDCPVTPSAPLHTRAILPPTPSLHPPSASRHGERAPAVQNRDMPVRVTSQKRFLKEVVRCILSSKSSWRPCCWPSCASHPYFLSPGKYLLSLT